MFSQRTYIIDVHIIQYLNFIKNKNSKSLEYIATVLLICIYMYTYFFMIISKFIK